MKTPQVFATFIAGWVAFMPQPAAAQPFVETVPRFRVNTDTANDQVQPDVAINDGGQFIVSFGSEDPVEPPAETDGGVIGGTVEAETQRNGVGASFDSDGTPSTSARRLGAAEALAREHYPGLLFRSANQTDVLGATASVFMFWYLKEQADENEAAEYAESMDFQSKVLAFQSVGNSYEDSVAFAKFDKIKRKYGLAAAWIICALSGTSGFTPPDIYCRALELGTAQDGDLQTRPPATEVGDPEFVVNSYTTGYQTNPEGCGTADGGFVVVWESLGQDGDQGGIFGRRFDGNLDPAGDDFPVNTYTTGRQEQPSVYCRRDGGFVVAWESRDTGNRGAFGRRFDANTMPVGDEFTIEEGFGITEPIVVGDGRDNFVVVWQGAGIAMRGFDRNGTPLSDAEQLVVNAPGAGVSVPRVAMNRHGDAVVTWSEIASDGDMSRDVHAIGFKFNGGNTTTSTSSTSSTSVTTTSSTTTTTMGGGPMICGDPVDPSALDAGAAPAAVTASDALFVLNAAIGVSTCELCVCDVNDSGGTTASDALAILNAAVGQPVTLTCPPCS